MSLPPLPRLLPWVLPPATLVALAAAARLPVLAPGGLLPAPVEIPLLALALLAASLPRAAGTSAGRAARELPAAGLGAAAVPSLVAFHGVVPAALAAALALLLLGSSRRGLARSCGVASSAGGGLPAALEGAAGGALSVLAGGMVWAWLAPPPGTAAGRQLLAVAAAVVLYLAVAALLRLARVPAGERRAVLLTPLALDLAGLLTGLAVARAVASEPSLAALLLAPVAALAVAVARNRLLYEGALVRLGEFERVRRAGHRMVEGTRELTALVEGLHGECREALAFAWFHFELLAGEAEVRSWGAGPDGRIFEGVPRPPRHPPALPGFHRRSPWTRIEKELTDEGEPVARLTFWCDPRRLPPEGLSLFDSLLPQMAASVHRALLDREAKQDPLTSLAVRRVLERRLAAAYRQACDGGGSLAVILCDLDHFKRINDTFGHPAGDRALVLAARALEGALRTKPPQDDLLARWGGEEFVVLLDGAGGEEALRVAERLRRAVEEVELHEGGAAVPLNASAGVAAFPDLHVKTAEELLVLADGALYEAKRRGRNLCLLDLGRGRFRDPRGRVLVAEDRPAPPEPPRLFS